MNILKKLNFTTPKFLTSLVGGLALFLVPNDAKNMADGVFRELYVAGIAILVVILIFILFKSFETIAISQIVAMTLIAINYALRNIQININESFGHLMLYDKVCFFLIWLIPFIFCIIVRIFLTDPKIYKSDHLKHDFEIFIKLSTVAFLIYYTIMLLSDFLFVGFVDFYSQREIVFFPYHSFLGIKKYIKCLLCFLPIGFFACIYRNGISFFKKVFFAFLFGIFIELFQFVFNTSVLNIFDVIFYMLGFALGVAIKKLLDAIRNHITRGDEITIFDF